MTKYTEKKIAAKLYRDCSQISDGYHEISYDVESDTLYVNFLQQNSWTNDANKITNMRGRMTPRDCFDIAPKVLCLIQEQEYALNQIKSEKID